ncbi:MAG TPA: iron ABC transporter permease [Acidimicrobiia bacterium]|nr:iron ABC transporter permease [Acidimicrobiia bacterium]
MTATGEPAQAVSRARRRRPPPLLVAAGALVGAGAALPLVYLFLRAAEGGVGRLLDTVSEHRTLELLVDTVGLAVAVTAGTVVLALPLGWLTARTDLPGRRAFAVLTALPLVLPSYVFGYAFVAAFGPVGLVQGWLEPLGMERFPNLYGFWGAFLVLTFSTYPYVLLTVRAALSGLDPALEEAGRSLGRSPAATFFSVVLPQLRPALAAGALLVALYALHDFGAVSLLRFDSFTRVIYSQYQNSFDRIRAATLGLVLVALTLSVLATETRLRGRLGVPRTRRGKAPPVALGQWRWPAALWCGLVVLFALGLPLGVISYWLFRGGAAGSSLRLTAELAGNSFAVSALGAGAALVAAWPVAVLSARYAGRLSRMIERASFIGFALPGLVVALALVFFGARFWGGRLYQTQVMLIAAYVILFLPQAVGALRTSLLQVSPSLEEAARSLGCDRRRVLWRVTLPLVRPGVVAAFGLVFLTAMKELSATLLLSPIEFTTLATQVWASTNEAFFAKAAAPALAIVAISAVPLLMTGRIGGDRPGVEGRWGRRRVVAGAGDPTGPMP